MRPLVLALGVLASSCSNDFEDLFEPVADSGVAHAALTAADLFAIYAGWGGDACGACLAARCMNETRACLADTDCAEQAECEAQCDDPACVLRCPAGIRGSARLDFWVTPGAVLSPDQCRASQCKQECSVGRTFSCLEEFEWPAPASPVGTATVVAGGAAPEATIAFCSGAVQECDGQAVSFEPLPSYEPAPGAPPFGAKTVDTLGLSRSPAFFELRHPATYTHLWYPLFDTSTVMPEIAVWLLAKEQIDVDGSSFRDPVTDGFVVLYTHDCQLDSAPAIRIGVDPPAADTEPWYGLSGSWQECGAAGGLAGFMHVDPGLVTVRATSCDTGEVVMSRRVRVRAGDLTLVDMTPRSRSEPP